MNNSKQKKQVITLHLPINLVIPVKDALKTIILYLIQLMFFLFLNAMFDNSVVTCVLCIIGLLLLIREVYNLATKNPRIILRKNDILYAHFWTPFIKKSLPWNHITSIDLHESKTPILQGHQYGASASGYVKLFRINFYCNKQRNGSRKKIDSVKVVSMTYNNIEFNPKEILSIIKKTYNKSKKTDTNDAVHINKRIIMSHKEKSGTHLYKITIKRLVIAVLELFIPVVVVSLIMVLFTVIMDWVLI